MIRGEREARLLHHVLELTTSAGSRTLNTAAGSGHGAAHAHRFPLLLVAGLGTAKALPERAVALIMRSNRLGLTGFTFMSLTAAYWMILVALDQLLSGPAAAAKYTGFLAAGHGNQREDFSRRTLQWRIDEYDCFFGFLELRA